MTKTFLRSMLVRFRMVKRHLPRAVTVAILRRTHRPVLLHARPDSWLARTRPWERDDDIRDILDHVDRRAVLSEGHGAVPIWEGYARPGRAARSSEEVRTNEVVGRLFLQLVLARRPRLVVEFGTAFGVSGMYWLAGLERIGSGLLCTFEPNAAWAAIARRNLDSVGNRFRLVEGTFEENAALLDEVDAAIDICLIDAIHTRDFVLPQFEIVRRRIGPEAIVVFDDIHFSDDMRACWQEVAARPDVVAALEFGNVGIVEMGPPQPPDRPETPRRPHSPGPGA